MTVFDTRDNAPRSVQPLVTSSRQRDLLEHIGYLTLIALWYVAVYYGTKALVAWVVS